jgi:hypothetical protein
MQNRKPPAYQEYAASILVNRHFRLMTLEERGLLFTLRLECWENKQAPISSRDLAKYTGCDIAEIEKALTDNVKTFFVEKSGFFISPDLEDYRTHLADRKKKQSQGGKLGSRITNSNRLAKTKDITSTPSSTLQLPSQGTNESLVQASTDKLSQTQSIKKEVVSINDSWVKEYEANDTYLK